MKPYDKKGQIMKRINHTYSMRQIKNCLSLNLPISVPAISDIFDSRNMFRDDPFTQYMFSSKLYTYFVMQGKPVFYPTRSVDEMIGDMKIENYSYDLQRMHLPGGKDIVYFDICKNGFEGCFVLKHEHMLMFVTFKNSMIYFNSIINDSEGYIESNAPDLEIVLHVLKMLIYLNSGKAYQKSFNFYTNFVNTKSIKPNTSKSVKKREKKENLLFDLTIAEETYSSQQYYQFKKQNIHSRKNRAHYVMGHFRVYGDHTTYVEGFFRGLGVVAS